MGIKFDNFKSRFSFSGKKRDSFSDKINYDDVSKNHGILIHDYKSLLKNSLSTRDSFCRTKFVESHIYKKLKKLRKIYSVEMADLSDSDTNRKKIEKLVKNIDEFLSVLFYFPTISIKGLTSLGPVIFAAVGTVSGIILHLHSIGLLEVVKTKFFLFLVFILLGYLFVILSLVSFSFMQKRFLFIFFSEDKPQGGHERVKSMRKAFLGKNIKETCYDKENELFQSLVVKKEPEQPVDIIILGYNMLIGICFFFALFMNYLVRSLDFLPFMGLTLCLWISPSIFMFYFQVKRKAK